MKALLFVIFLLHALMGNASEFGYGKNDQLKWRSVYYSCGGTMQSPILINSSIAIPMGMPALEMIGYHNNFLEKLILQNNGHSVALTISKQKKVYEGYENDIPYIFGALLDSQYKFEGLHFHWGEKNNRGSEHILNDIRYPLELHLIHRNTKYNSMEQALKRKDGLTVLAVFFQLREKKLKYLDALLKYFPEIRKFQSSVNVTNTFKLGTLLPSDTEIFYTYKGSLTTPPCSEVVTWIIYPEPVLISFSQMDKFRLLYSDPNNVILADNYRHLQPLGSRKIFVRKPGWKLSSYFATSNFFKWIWYN